MANSNPAEFEQLMQSLQSSNNEQRSKAETYYNSLLDKPDYVINMLTTMLESSQDLSVRQLSCVLVRRLFSNESIFSQLAPEAQLQVRGRFFTLLESEKVETIRKKLTHVISALAGYYARHNQFEDVMPELFKWSQSDIEGQRLSALNIFCNMAPFLIDDNLKHHLETLKNVFADCLNNSSSRVRVSAVEAITAVVISVEKSIARRLDHLAPSMLEAIAATLNDQNFEGAETAIEKFIDIADTQHHFFRQCSGQVIEAMFTIASTESLQQNIRHLAIEFMITLSESSPATVKRLPHFIDNVFPLCMGMMLDIEEDPDWADTPEDHDESELTNYDVGLEALDRLAIALGGEIVQPVAFSIIPRYLNEGDWKEKHAGLMAISQTAEGCVLQYEQHLGEIVSMVLGMFHDEQPRVRFAAIHCIAQLSTDFSPSFQAVFHSQVVPAIINAMDDTIPKVQAHAATAIVNFVEPCQNEFIGPYLDSLLSKLIVLLKAGKHFVQEQALSAISAVASASEGLFAEYYVHIMPLLMDILNSALHKQQRLLRARAMECATLIAVAVKKEKLGDDAQQILNLLYNIEQSPLEPDDPMVNYLLQAWGRMAKVLGPDFIPYLDFVVPRLLQNADVKPEVIIADAHDEHQEGEEDMESMTLSIKGVGDKRISIRTSTLEDKSIACNMLYTYARELKNGFFKYVNQTAKIMVPLLKFAYLDEIRETAASIMSELVTSTRMAIEHDNANPQLLKELVDFICKTFFEAIQVEPEFKTGSILADSLSEMLAAAQTNILDQGQLEQLTVVFREVLVRCLNKRQELYSEMAEAEDESEREFIEAENSLVEENIFSLEECITTVIKTHYDTFIEMFVSQLWPIFTQMLSSQLHDVEYRLSLCMICDFVEHGRGRAEQFMQDIVNAFMAYAKSDNPSIRQPAVYGLGVCADHSGEYFGNRAQEAVSILQSVIFEEGSKSEEKGAATANAVSSLYKIARSRSDFVNVQEAMSMWTQALPVSVDIIEAKIVHKNLLAHTQEFDPLVVGSNKENLPHIVSVFAQIGGSELVDPETHEGIKSFLRQLMSEGHLEQCIEGMNDQLKERLHQIMSS